MSEPTLAWCAGFFDGEGHIAIADSPGTHQTALMITVVQRTKEPLPIFQKEFGGAISFRTLPPSPGTIARRPLWKWQISTAAAERFLRAVLPYLQNKRDEALLALAYRATYVPQYTVGKPRFLPANLVIQRKTFAVEMKALRVHKKELAYV